MKSFKDVATLVVAVSLVLNSVGASFAIASDSNQLSASIQQKLQEKEAAIAQRNKDISELENQIKRELVSSGVNPQMLTYAGIVGSFGSTAKALQILTTARPDLQEILQAYLNEVNGKPVAPVAQVTTGQLIKRASPWVALIIAFSAVSIFGTQVTIETDKKVKQLSETVLELNRMNQRDAEAVSTLKAIISSN